MSVQFFDRCFESIDDGSKPVFNVPEPIEMIRFESECMNRGI